MIVKAVRTDKILPGGLSIFEVLDKAILELKEGSVVAITSKIVSICEGRVVPIGSIDDKEELIKQEADFYLPSEIGNYGYHFTITNHSLASSAGIDESNGAGHYILWPSDAQKTANLLRKYLKDRFNLEQVGVIITDSTLMPLRWGTRGTALAYSGFAALKSYIGQPDLFGRPFVMSQAGIAENLATAAVLVMGEGAEQTPLALIEDINFVEFQTQDPTKQNLELFYMAKKEEDIYAPFFNSVKWLPGNRKGR